MIHALEIRSIGRLLRPARLHQHLHDSQSGAAAAANCECYHVADWSVRAFLFHCNHCTRITPRKYTRVGAHRRLHTEVDTRAQHGRRAQRQHTIMGYTDRFHGRIYNKVLVEEHFRMHARTDANMGWAAFAHLKAPWQVGGNGRSFAIKDCVQNGRVVLEFRIWDLVGETFGLVTSSPNDKHITSRGGDSLGLVSSASRNIIWYILFFHSLRA